MKCLNIFFILFLVGCASRYPNWQHVRIEYKIPHPECKYIIQEACYKRGAGCFNYYKQRATVFKANTVVLTRVSEATSGRAGIFQGSGGASSNPTLTTLADYYSCPK